MLSGTLSELLSMWSMAKPIAFLTPLALAPCSKSKPATLTRPDVFFRRVLKILMVVLFPAPLGPKKPKNSPRPTVKLMPERALTSPG